MAFLPKAVADKVQSTGSGNYLNPGKLASGASMRFALCEKEPLCFFECWGESNADGKLKPFRFLEEPTADDIEAEMGNEFTRRQNRDGTGYEPAKFGIAVACWSYESESIGILSLSQKSLIRAIDEISQSEDYAVLTDWDFSISREGTGLATEYTLLPLPPKADRKEIKEAYEKAILAGFQIKQLISGGNPFPPSK